MLAAQHNGLILQMVNVAQRTTMSATANSCISVLQQLFPVNDYAKCTDAAVSQVDSERQNHFSPTMSQCDKMSDIVGEKVKAT